MKELKEYLEEILGNPEFKDKAIVELAVLGTELAKLCPERSKEELRQLFEQARLISKLINDKINNQAKI